MKDALFDAIVAHPDDDDARLVWADREGGERGELVVIQCALAKGGQSREERRKLYTRERELLAKPWPEAEGLAARFERGFIAHAAMRLHEVAPALARHPLLASIELIDATKPAGAPSWDTYAAQLARVLDALEPGRITKLTGTANPPIESGLDWARYANRTDAFVALIASTPAGRALRCLRVAGDARLSYEGYEQLHGWESLEELYVYGPVPFDRITAFAASCPRLRGLTVWLGRRNEDPEPLLRSLSYLETGFGFEALAAMALPKLRRLKINLLRASSSAFHTFTRAEGLPNLTSLDVEGIDDWMLQYLAEATFAPNLRELTLHGNDALSARSIVRLRDSFPKLDRLDLRGTLNRRAFASVAEVIPLVRL